MASKDCPACGHPFLHKDKVMAFMPSRFVDIPSSVTFAIHEPRKCYAIVHWRCFTFPFGEWHEPEEN